MAYGFLLIYLRDFTTGRVNSYSIGQHFESILAHIHGNLFALLNIIIGYLLMQFHDKLSNTKITYWLGVMGLLVPLG
jgi:hypothetical protein